MSLEIKSLSKELEDIAFSYLKSHEELTMFMMANLREQGTKLTSHRNSGNFYALLENDRLQGVFVLCKRGNLLAQLDNPKKSMKPILDFLEKDEKITISGVLGDNIMASPYWKEILKRNPEVKKSYESCEILYALAKKNWNVTPTIETKVLATEDYPLWKKYMNQFLKENGLIDAANEKERHTSFLKSIKKRTIWGYYKKDTLLSTATLNAHVGNLAQVGGVYTPVKERGNGFSKRCMERLLSDCFNKLGIEKVILFTGGENISAQNVYEKIGFKRIGHYGLYNGTN